MRPNSLTVEERAFEVAADLRAAATPSILFFDRDDYLSDWLGPGMLQGGGRGPGRGPGAHAQAMVEPAHSVQFGGIPGGSAVLAGKATLTSSIMKNEAGRSVEFCFISSRSPIRPVPDEVKQRPLIVAPPLRSGKGPEPIPFSGSPEWLLGRERFVARETRRKQLVLLMPMVNGDSFFDPRGEAPPLNRDGMNIYSGKMRVFHLADDRGSRRLDLGHDGPGNWKYLEEGAGDRRLPCRGRPLPAGGWRPDMHGVDVRYNGQLPAPLQSVGSAGSNYLR